MRGPDAEHQVERLRGDEVPGLLVMEDEALLDTEVARGPAGLCQGVLGDVHALGMQARAREQGAQEPLPAAATKVEHPLVATREPPFQQPAHRVVVERRLYRVIGMGDPGDLFTVHRRSLSTMQVARTLFSSEGWSPSRQPPIRRSRCP
jgi:hypothetical protein